jgi:hypothetical protein
MVPIKNSLGFIAKKIQGHLDLMWMHLICQFIFLSPPLTPPNMAQQACKSCIFCGQFVEMYLSCINFTLKYTYMYFLNKCPIFHTWTSCQTHTLSMSYILFQFPFVWMLCLMDTITCPLVSLELRVIRKLTISFIRLGYLEPELELNQNWNWNEIFFFKIGLRLNPGFYVFGEPKPDPF